MQYAIWRCVALTIVAALLAGTAGAVVVGQPAPSHTTTRVAPTAHHHAAGPAMDGMAMEPLSHTHPGAATTPVTSLTGPRTAAHVRTFTLTARPARLTLAHGVRVDAWTYDGTSPGPLLRVRQGDLVVVHLVNRLPVATTIHWHGVVLPNAEDGVAGSTQDAVPPRQTYTYRFVAAQAGTYWYHAHQDSLTQVARGLYGALVVAPAVPGERDGVDGVDDTLIVHNWRVGGQDILTVNRSTAPQRIAARPGALVRLRLVNADTITHLLTPVGVPFTVAALDGHDLHNPQPLRATLLPVGAGQRYDVRFRLPARGAVAIYLNDLPDDQHRDRIGPSRLAAVIGAGPVPSHPRGRPVWFVFTTYGTAQPRALAPFAHPSATSTLRLGMRATFSLADSATHFTINGQTAPDTTPIMVRRGQVIRLHIVNDTPYIHPMHLHGHTFVVLTRNGRPLRGSPITLDTLNVYPSESYDIAFKADNPGIWMLHCHNLNHARLGMSLMVMYAGITTPFQTGGPAGNIPD